MINEQWFRKYQKTLLFFLKFKWFRRLLQIKTDEKIIGILPHCYTVHLGGQRLKTDFRTRPTFARNLYKYFKAIFWTMHIWDLIADPIMPKLSFGLSSLTVNPVPGSTVDGYAAQTFGSGSNTWDEVRNAAGNTHNNTSANTVMWAFDDFSVPATGWNDIYRSIYLFDTSPLGAGATFNSAIFSVYVTSKTKSIPAWTPATALVSSNPASDTTLANSDYQNLGSTDFASRIAYASITTSAYNDMTMNAAGLAAISLTGITKLGIREGNYDLDDVDPGATGGANGSHIFGDYSENGSNEPKLVIDYIAATVILARPIYT